MIKHIEKLLFDKTKDTKSDILYAQWNFDKRVIPSALQAVSNLFPHYSLHDESHSISIVNNIVRIIGIDNLEKLSAIDLWLILEASYYHDIGMVVSADKLNEAINSGEFPQFLEQIKQDNKNSLYETANLFDVVEGKIKFKNDNFSLEVLDGIKYLLAEFFRKYHSDRSTDIILNPEVELSILSPRAIIPARIFKILAEICACHTKDFIDVYNLPFTEVGIDIEDAHPRYIACLLRIGDLLDLDNNRFSEVMLRTLTKIPLDTLRHKSKHLSIERFRADRDKIEIKAKCDKYETASITQHWFNYLNFEISNQMAKWNDIVPSKELGYLPTVGDLKVELLQYDLIDGKNKPKFSVDTDKALSLLQGAGIYDGAYQCIREILQNSVDATLIRIWLEHKIDNDFVNPQDKSFLELVKNYPIKISIKSTAPNVHFKNWQLIISDCGTGISTTDLMFLMNTGSSTKNRERSRIIDSMPNWMRPSGTFGIGFQSIFMLSNTVKLETKSFFDEQLQFIELNSPNSAKDGDILIEKKKSTHSIKPGTKLIIDYSTPIIPKSYSISSKHRNASLIAHNYDPFFHDSLDVELGQILDEILDFSFKCNMPIKLDIDGEEIGTMPLRESRFDYYDPINSLELTFQIGDITNKFGSYHINTYYKSQFADNNLRIEFLGIAVNIHQERASEVLTLNRNEIKREFQNKLYSQIIDSTFRILIQHFELIFTTKELKISGSMFLNYYSHLEIVKKNNIDQFDQWKNFEIGINNTMYIMNSLLNDFDTLKLIHKREEHSFMGDIYNITGTTLEITINGGGPAFEYTKFLLYMAKGYYTNISKFPDMIGTVKEIIFTKENKQSVNLDSEILTILTSHKKGIPNTARAFIPCSEAFLDLRVKDNARISYVSNYLIDDILYMAFPKMISPYVRFENTDKTLEMKLVLNEKLLDWVFNNRYNEQTTKVQISEAYMLFTSSFSLVEINNASSNQSNQTYYQP